MLDKPNWAEVKSMKVYLILVCLLPFLIGCSEDTRPDHCKFADEIMNQFVSDAKERYGLFCHGSGGRFLNRVNAIHLSFVTLGPKSQEELRVMMVTITEDFLKRMNSHEEIREYLVNYPFQSTNLKFRISLMDLDGRVIHNKGKEKELLRGVILFNGKLLYEIKNDDKAYLQDVHSETYEEARAIVKKQHPELFLSP